jgi:hypothetical protein
MQSLLTKLLPPVADNIFLGPKVALWVFILIAAISTVRSFIHILAPDGGSGSIAGMDLSAGAPGIIFAFALWGSAQLIYALIQLTVIFRYRSLIPFMYGIQILESLLRVAVARMKPVTFSHTPPGAWQNYLYPPLCLLMLWLSITDWEKVSSS